MSIIDDLNQLGIDSALALARSDAEPTSLSMSELLQSTPAQRIGLDLNSSDVSVVKAVSSSRNPRPWRVTLSRVDRRDGRPALVQDGVSNSEYLSDLFAYTAGQEGVPALPPRRTNPVYGPTRNIGRLAVQLAWGQANAAPFRLIADWPMQGGSIVLVAQSVEVFARSTVQTLDGSEITDQGLAPEVTATIAPWDGLPTADGGELGISQTIFLSEPSPPPPDTTTWGAAVYVPDFARRVCVQSVVSSVVPSLGDEIPDGGMPTQRLAFYDDGGNLLYAAMEGLFFGLGGGGSQQYVPPKWHVVPPQATIMLVRQASNTSHNALVNWRIAP